MELLIMKRLLFALTIAKLSTGVAFAQSPTTTTGGSSTTTTTTMPSTTTDQGTDSTTTSGTNSNSAKDCAPGQQTGSAKQAAPKICGPRSDENDDGRLLMHSYQAV